MRLIQVIRDVDLGSSCLAGSAEAIAHINHYSTHHSDAIITQRYDAAQRFLNAIDSAADCAAASSISRLSAALQTEGRDVLAL